MDKLGKLLILKYAVQGFDVAFNIKVFFQFFVFFIEFQEKEIIFLYFSGIVNFNFVELSLKTRLLYKSFNSTVKIDFALFDAFNLFFDSFKSIFIGFSG